MTTKTNSHKEMEAGRVFWARNEESKTERKDAEYRKLPPTNATNSLTEAIRMASKQEQSEHISPKVYIHRSHQSTTQNATPAREGVAVLTKPILNFEKDSNLHNTTETSPVVERTHGDKILSNTSSTSSQAGKESKAVPKFSAASYGSVDTHSDLGIRKDNADDELFRVVHIVTTRFQMKQGHAPLLGRA